MCLLLTVVVVPLLVNTTAASKKPVFISCVLKKEIGKKAMSVMEFTFSVDLIALHQFL